MHCFRNDDREDDENLKFKTKFLQNEPQIFAEPNSNSSINIMFNVKADFCSYSCSVSEINFTDTFAFQESSQSFEVKNTSKIDLTLEWCMWMDERFPRRLNSPVFTNRKRDEADTTDAVKTIKHPRNLPQCSSILEGSITTRVV